MKRKLYLILLSVLVAVFLAGCSGSGGGSAAAETKAKVDITKMTAAEIIQKYVDAGFPIANVIDYTAETDKNNLLGRPNQYTSKVNFADTRAKQPSDPGISPVGGSIEVFNNAEDAQARNDYITPIAKVSMFSQYLYLYKNVFLRIDGALTPDQAAQYEVAFISLQNGDLPKQFAETTK